MAGLLMMMRIGYALKALTDFTTYRCHAMQHLSFRLPCRTPGMAQPR